MLVEVNFGWSTRAELQFLEALWAGKLDSPAPIPLFDPMVALRGYAEGYHRRRNWGMIDREVVKAWLENHGLLRGY